MVMDILTLLIATQEIKLNGLTPIMMDMETIGLMELGICREQEE
jgi:hypothetical protein